MTTITISTFSSTNIEVPEITNTGFRVFYLTAPRKIIRLSQPARATATKPGRDGLVTSRLNSWASGNTKISVHPSDHSLLFLLPFPIFPGSDNMIDGLGAMALAGGLSSLTMLEMLDLW